LKRGYEHQSSKSFLLFLRGLFFLASWAIPANKAWVHVMRPNIHHTWAAGSNAYAPLALLFSLQCLSPLPPLESLINFFIKILLFFKNYIHNMHALSLSFSSLSYFLLPNKNVTSHLNALQQLLDQLQVGVAACSSPIDRSADPAVTCVQF